MAFALSDEWIGRILGQGPTAVASAADDRRRAPRLPVGKRARMRPLDRGVWDTVLLRDISAHGAGCLCAAPLPVRARFVLEVSDSAGEPVRLQCVTRRCEPGGYGRTGFVIGGLFEAMLDGDDADEPARGSGSAQWRGRLSSVASLMSPARLRLRFQRQDDHSSETDRRWLAARPQWPEQ